MNKNLKRYMSKILICSLISASLIGRFGSHASALTVDQLYKNAYESVVQTQKLGTQQSISIARENIDKLKNTDASWAIGEFSTQVDFVQHQILVKIVDSINFAKENVNQTNINKARALIDSELPTTWKNSYSSAVDVIQQELMNKALEAMAKANETGLIPDADIAASILSDIFKSKDENIIKWGKMQFNDFYNQIVFEI